MLKPADIRLTLFQFHSTMKRCFPTVSVFTSFSELSAARK